MSRIYISSPTDWWWLPAEIAISLVKQHWGRILLGWKTAWERAVGFFEREKFVVQIRLSQVGRAVQGVRLKI